MMPNCYVYYGVEEFLRVRAIAALAAQLGDASLAGMNVAALDGRKVMLPELRDAVEALPFLVENRLPDLPAIVGLPNASAGRTNVVGRGLARHSGNRGDSASAMRPDQSPFHGLQPTGVEWGEALVAYEFVGAHHASR